jgi:hypothetical protein
VFHEHIKFTGEFEPYFAEDTSSLDWISQKSMQKEVDKMCYTLRILLPTYELQEVHGFGGVEYVKYSASLQVGAKGTRTILVGRFGKTEYDAKEDVAVLLIRQLLLYCGRKIRDFNHYNLEDMVHTIKSLEDENLELKMELAMVRAEVDVAKTKGKGKKKY